MRDKENDECSEGSKDSMKRMVEYALLYDFYGALLKDKNRKIFEDYMFNDMSLAEIALEAEITRQGVSDIVRRSGRKLMEFEDSLGLIRRFDRAKELAHSVKRETCQIRKSIEAFRESVVQKNDIENVNRIISHLEVIENDTECILDEF